MVLVMNNIFTHKRFGDSTCKKGWQDAAQFIWQTVHDHHTVLISGNSGKEHFHDDRDFFLIKLCAQAQVCPLEASPLFLSNSKKFFV